jgi:hypothetical protein
MTCPPVIAKTIRARATPMARVRSIWTRRRAAGGAGNGDAAAPCANSSQLLAIASQCLVGVTRPRQIVSG